MRIMDTMSPETLGSRAESLGRTLDAVDLLLEGLMELAINREVPEATHVMAAQLLLAEARVHPRLLLEEVDFQNRVDARRGIL